MSAWFAKLSDPELDRSSHLRIGRSRADFDLSYAAKIIPQFFVTESANSSKLAAEIDTVENYTFLLINEEENLN
jgi:hypothetical protein